MKQNTPNEIPNRENPDKTYPPQDTHTPNKNNPINPQADENLTNKTPGK